MSKGQLKKLLRFVSFVIAVGFLVWLLDRIGWDTIGSSFVRVGWGGALLLLALGFVETFFDSASFKAAQQGRIGIWRAMSYNGAGAIVNVVIPWEAGEAVKGTLLARHMSTSQAIQGTVIWNYLFKLSRPGIALLAALTAVVLGHEGRQAVTWMVLAACLVAFAPYVVFRVLLKFGMAHMVVRLLKSLRILRRDTDSLVAAAKELDTNIQRFRQNSPGAYWQVLISQSLARIAAWFTLGVVIHMVGLDFSVGLVSLIYASFSVLAYVVMLFPVRIGFSEGAGYLAFALLGLDGGMGLIVTVIGRIKALMNNGIPGAFASFLAPTRSGEPK